MFSAEELLQRHLVLNKKVCKLLNAREQECAGLLEHAKRQTLTEEDPLFRKPGRPPCGGIFHSTRSIRYPTPTWVCIYWGAAGSFSIFLRNVAINTRRDAMSFSQLLPQICWVI